MRWPKVKSGALQLTIYVGVLVALLLSGLILYAYTFLFVRQQSEMSANSVTLADSGMAYALDVQQLSKDTASLGFHGIENQKIEVYVSQWGVFRKASVTSTYRKKAFVKCALLGSQIAPDVSPTLYLQDLDKPLAVVGDALLKGNVYLPHLGIKPGYIMGNSYYNTQLVYGVQKTSSGKLPELDSGLVGSLDMYTRKLDPSDYVKFLDHKANSFFGPAKIVHSGQVIRLDAKLTGNIIVKSDTLVRIASSSRLTDVLIVAPHIVIEDGVNGKFQAIASKTITVGERVKMEYPSALAIKVNPDEDYKKPLITIAKDSEISGVILYLDSRAASNFETQVLISEKASVKGSVYCSGNLELQGQVTGSVITSQFVCKAGGSVYLNHIFNGKVTNERLPDTFAGTVMKEGKKCIAQWLY